MHLVPTGQAHQTRIGGAAAQPGAEATGLKRNALACLTHCNTTGTRLLPDVPYPEAWQHHHSPQEIAVAHPNGHAVELHHVSKVYRQGAIPVRALDGVSLRVPAGAFVAIMGASGSGKSTLLHIAAGLTTPDAGDVSLFGQALQRLSDDELTRFRRERVGLIFQTFNLLPTMTALENVGLPLLIQGKPLAHIRPRALALLDAVGLSDRRDHRPDELSGGQQQRVAIARALVHDAPLLLADEPTGNLDSRAGKDVLGLIRDLARQHARTVILVTHAPDAAAIADSVVHLADGRLVDGLTGQ
ncbi:MAG: ABC transporter ATP-binding protein [Anaerolineae bacterium]|nr:ABC transporter ATP-binding protein [Anaerolineae bacterium]